VTLRVQHENIRKARNMLNAVHKNACNPLFILENSPRDLIVGLPTIIDHNIVQKLEPY
jgi:hypothetical protein